MKYISGQIMIFKTDGTLSVLAMSVIKPSTFFLLGLGAVILRKRTGFLPAQE
jgi:hypothetical protein